LGQQIMDNNSVARGLAWFGIGLGVVELLYPREVARATGLDGHATLIQAFGAREILSGIAILAADEPQQWLGLRVSGDLLDGGLLGAGMMPSNPGQSKSMLATLAVAPVVVLDIIYWLKAREA
jgi:hypothetical protein